MTVLTATRAGNNTGSTYMKLAVQASSTTRATKAQATAYTADRSLHPQAPLPLHAPALRSRIASRDPCDHAAMLLHLPAAPFTLAGEQVACEHFVIGLHGPQQ